MSFLRRNTFRRNTSTGVHASGLTAGSDGTSADSSHRERAPIDDSDYARRSREIMEFYNSLENLGAGKFLENYFPEIVVIGGQSAGKSSLIEAVSKITVPRDSGTCTRCPMQCKLVSAPEGTPWTCTIELRFLHDEGQHDDTPFVTLTSPQDVEIYLRRAQAAILCPGRPKEFFLGKSHDELKRFAEEHKDDISSFSESTIVVNIRGPNLTDLTFVDLPGLILKTADTEVAMLQGMVRRRIMSSKTIVLTAIPMCEDMARQEAKQISDEMDPRGERTIGVLTKPDTLSAGSSGAREFWRKVLMGEVEPLKHGYFCVRLPDDDQRRQNLSPSALTTQLLRDVAPWKDMSDKSRFGVDNLVSYMSQLLLALFEQSIPAMHDRVLVLIAETQREFDALGPPPDLDNATTHVLLLVNAFYANLKNMIAGTCNKEHKTMIRTNRGYYGNMRDSVLRTCPIFTFDDRVHSSPTDPIMNQSQYRLTLEDVKKSIQENTAWVLPGEVPLEATRDLIEGFTKRWTRPTISCFDNVFDNSRRSIIALAHSHFGVVQSLEDHVSSIINNEMTNRRRAALVIVKKVIDLENRIYTVDPQFATEKASWLTRLHAAYSNRHFTHAPTAYDSELDVMAKVWAYFQVAHKRHIDTITATIENELHEPLPNQISKALIDSLSDADRARELLTESPGRLAERARLTDRLARLTEIKAQLEAFGIPRRVTPDSEVVVPAASMTPSSEASILLPSRAPSVVSLERRRAYGAGNW